MIRTFATAVSTVAVVAVSTFALSGAGTGAESATPAPAQISNVSGSGTIFGCC